MRSLIKWLCVIVRNATEQAFQWNFDPTYFCFEKDNDIAIGVVYKCVIVPHDCH